MKILAVDTETTGLDIFHGCRPFLITACDGQTNYIWEGSVDEYTRNVTWEQSELDEVQYLLDNADSVIFHNGNFDRRALASIGISLDHLLPRIQDTLVASHVLCSGDVHGLKDLAIKYLRYHNKDEEYLRDCITHKRQQLSHTNTAIAREGHPFFPAVRGKSGTSWWAMDMWLDMEACKKYASRDTERTYLLWLTFARGLMDQDLVRVYRKRMDLLPVLYDMQSHGIPIYIEKCERLIKHLKFQEQALLNQIIATTGWKGYLNPESPIHMQKLLFSPQYLNLEPINDTKASTPENPKHATDKATLKLLFEENPNVLALKYLQSWREVSTELSYVQSYIDWSTVHVERADNNNLIINNPNTTITNSSEHRHNRSILSPSQKIDEVEQASVRSTSKIITHRLHSALNLTGTKWTRQSSSDPNQQNFKKELKYLFGPPEGYYWLYMDVVNIELCIWAYEVGSRQLIEAFESGESVHMIIARTIRQHQIDMAGGEGAWKLTDAIHKQYTNTKGGTFAWIYGGSTRKVNQTYGIPNAQEMIKDKLPEVGKYFEQLNRTMTANIARYGYPTMFTRAGYKLEVPRTKPHKVPSARIQGSAGEIVQDMMWHMVRHPAYIQTNSRLIQQVHDSLSTQIPVHPSSDLTNKALKEECERVGKLHMPTCRMDAEIILPTPNEPIRIKIHSILPETYKDFTISYFFQDNVGWIANAKYESLIIDGIGKTQQEAYETLIQKIG